MELIQTGTLVKDVLKMDMTNIFDELMQSIEENSFPYIYAKAEYRQKQHCAEQHMQWLEEHLNEEEKTHLEQLRNAELRITTLECEALVKIAVAAGIRFALPH